MHLALTRNEFLPSDAVSILIELHIWRCTTSLIFLIVFRSCCFSYCFYLLFLFLLDLTSFGRRIEIGFLDVTVASTPLIVTTTDSDMIANSIDFRHLSPISRCLGKHNHFVFGKL